MDYKNEKLLQDVELEDFKSTNMRLVAETCGIDIAIKLMQELSGIVIYVPTAQKGVTPAIVRNLNKRYDGTRECLNKLSKESGINTNRLYTLLNKQETL